MLQNIQCKEIPKNMKEKAKMISRDFSLVACVNYMLDVGYLDDLWIMIFWFIYDFFSILF
jgi:hypothetical protein